MQKILLELILILFCSFVSLGQKYYTLNSGNFNNTADVWSLDGVTPCGCFPGNNLIADSLIIDHTINLTANLTAASLSKIQIHNGGSLSNSSFDLTIDNSIVLSHGSVNLRKLNIAPGGSFSIENSSLIISSSMDIYGSFLATFSNVTVINGNIQIYPTGSFIISDNSRIHFQMGNFKNEGYTSICSICCISFDKGNVLNESTGTFTGGGTVNSSLGNIKNYGIWDPLITYCTSGNDVGMVSPENCILANEICTYAPLPVELLYFKGYPTDHANILLWETASEFNTASYKLVRSFDGNDWTELVEVFANTGSQEVNNYAYTDNAIGGGTTYYRLVKISVNGEQEVLETISLTNDFDEQLKIYPNPSKGEVTVRVDEKSKIERLLIYDAIGRFIEEIDLTENVYFSFELPKDKGIYFLHVSGLDFNELQTVIKE